ncbi:MAG TPA: UvrD-helicase domain-containing protein [Clostridia bacterium]|jgi:ATP-dependent helicase/nuclease subunit A|nr:UvrD-helicase domain-containing protein [Clostridia bacterium]HQO54739.1 UvrD-helicase domain-containing protein [Clostridia bacterium]HUM61126.1 UvrD-helicase domain-containing protein [Clostridia bacterium]
MPEWTPRQKQAITARNRDILVSAAAGSGKTAVLIERVLSLLKEGMQLDRMLVMTFTHAAAEEMKERLTDLLSREAAGDEHLRRQFSLLGRADISTLHSFCQRLLRRHFQAVGADPLARLADESLARELFDRALDEAMDAFFEAPSADRLALGERFTQDEIQDMARSLYNFLMAQAAPFEWLDQALEASVPADLYGHPWYGVMAREALLMLEGAAGFLRMAEDCCLRPDGPARYLNAIRDDLAMVADLSERLSAPGRFAWNKPVFTRLPSTKPPPEEDPALKEWVHKTLRETSKKLIVDALELLPRDGQEADAWAGQVRATRPQLQALAGLVRDTAERYRALKAQKSLWDFNDLEHLAFQALRDLQVHREVSGAYDALFVDEYQDISRIQEAIIQRLHGPDNTLFMVGDVKQSIYRFRQADPTLFLSKYRSFETDEKAPRRLITLKENFRSAGNILRAVNLVFEHAMQKDATEIDYDDEARLSTLGDEDAGAPVELWILEKDAEPAEAAEESEADELLRGDWAEEEAEEQEEGGSSRGAGGEMERAFVYEARLIARRIRSLVGTRIADVDGERELQYRDIAILLRSASGRAAVMAEILNARDIPTYSDADGEFYTQSDVRDVLSILEVLDNPCQDIPLLSALSCPAFGFTPDELAQLRLRAPGRDRPLHTAFFELAQSDSRFGGAARQLERWRMMAQSMPLEKFLARLLRESGLYAVAGAKEDGLLRRANLRILVSRAASAPEPQNLADFVERARRAARQPGRDRSASLGMQENVVRIMTMHKSKGLQFPVVFLPDLAAAFSGKRRPLPLVLDAQAGLALIQVDPALRAKQEGFAVRAMKVKKNREELSEEARLLYVGMTRARQRLILIAAPRQPVIGRARDSLTEGSYAAGSAKCMLDWVSAPLRDALAQRPDGLYTAPGGSRWQLRMLGISALAEQARPAPEARPAVLEMAGCEAPEDLFAPLATGARLPQKSSVTALVTGGFRDPALLEQTEETPELKRHALAPSRTLRPLRDSSGGSALSAAQRGAAAHKALCALDPALFTGLEGQQLMPALRLAMDELAGRGLLLSAERQALDEAAVARFYRSDLARRMARSPQRHAEWPFTLLADEQVILQGVLDACFLEEGAWVLVDYKTDRGEAKDILARYRDQMRWYMRALRDITGLAVREAWLYLLRTGEAVRVEEEAPIRLA